MTSGEPLRLQKYLAQAGVASRRSSEELILQGRVVVNGTRVRELGTKVNPASDRVLLDGKPVDLEAKELYLFHKPRGVVSTLSDEQGRRCLADFLKKIPTRLFSVGRLDVNVNGLMLLTNDGDFANKLMHPRHQVPRIYQAIVSGEVSRKTLALLKNGLMLEDGWGKAADARVLNDSSEYRQLLGAVCREDETTLEISVCEGRKHFVKNLLSEAGHPVKRLSRVSFGDFKLGKLAPGKIKKVNFLV